jgi:hypothetical protein
VRDTKPHPPAQQLGVLFMLGARMDPVTGCGWTTRDQLILDCGVNKNTVTAAVRWATGHFLLRKLERGHYRGDGSRTGTWWVLASTTTTEDIEAPASTPSQEDIETSTTSTEDIEGGSRTSTEDIDDSSMSPREDIENGSLRLARSPLSKTTTGAVKDLTPEKQPTVVSSPAPRGAGLDLPGARPDVERLCEHLADRIEGNGSLRPAIGKTWRQAARLLLDKDGRTEEQVHRAIDWCQDDAFWKGNIESMPTLRRQYDRLRLHAQRAQAGNGRASGVGQVLEAMNETAGAAERYYAQPPLAITDGDDP